MTSMRVAPCNWPLAYCGEAGPSVECPTLAALDPATATIIKSMATEFLWHWTARQFGTCPVTIRPCREQCLDDWTTYRGRGWPTTNLPWFEGSPGPLNPALIGGQWYNLGCGGSCNSDPCSCSYVPTVELRGPVESIVSVKMNGAVLDPATYRVDNFRYLVRLDGPDWPVCQNMLLDPDTDDDTFEVTYNIGTTVPAGGQMAAGVLACQMAKAACGGAGCVLPQRLQTITRQGVTMTLLDSYNSLYENGTTGIFIVDSWVSSINASNKRAGMRVASPDVWRTRRTTG